MGRKWLISALPPYDRPRQGLLLLWRHRFHLHWPRPLSGLSMLLAGTGSLAPAEARRLGLQPIQT